MVACPSWFNCSDEKRQNLSLLQIIKLLIVGVGDDDCPALNVTGTINAETTATSTERIPTRTLDDTVDASNTKTIAAGARSVTIETSEDFTGEILGVTAQPNRVYPFEVKQNDDTLGIITYKLTAGSVIIGKLV